MLNAVLKKGAIVPLEPLPPEWKEGAALEVPKADAPQMDIDAGAKAMNESMRSHCIANSVVE